MRGKKRRKESESKEVIKICQVDDFHLATFFFHHDFPFNLHICEFAKFIFHFHTSSYSLSYISFSREHVHIFFECEAYETVGDENV